MAIEFAVTVTDVPGSLAHLGQALGDERVNIEAIQGTTGAGQGQVRFVADDRERAKRALAAAGFPYATREVLVVRVLDEPGALGEVALVMATAGDQHRLGLRHDQGIRRPRRG
jgi:hypothetical protein